MPTNQRLILIVVLLFVCVLSTVVGLTSSNSAPYGPQFWIIVFGGVAGVVSVVTWFRNRRK
jgi:hypothetical protein